jgi:uncharacterized coiled-coil DUF342 family protein
MNRLVAVFAAAAIGLTLAACGEEDVNELRDQVESSAQELRQEGRELKRKIEQGAPREELRKELDEFEKKARDEGEEIRKEAEELEKEFRDAVERQTP